MIENLTAIAGLTLKKITDEIYEAAKGQISSKIKKVITERNLEMVAQKNLYLENVKTFYDPENPIKLNDIYYSGAALFQTDKSETVSSYEYSGSFGCNQVLVEGGPGKERHYI